MKKLIYCVLICTIMVSHSTIIKAMDTDSPPDDLNRGSHSTTIRIGDSDTINQEQTKVTKEGVYDGILYLRVSHLFELLSSPSGENIIRKSSNPTLNGLRYVKFEDEEGRKDEEGKVVEITYVFPMTFEEYRSILDGVGDEKLIPCRLTSLYLGSSTWGVDVDPPSEEEFS